MTRPGDGMSDDLEAAADWLRAQAPPAAPEDLDRLKVRARAQAASTPRSRAPVGRPTGAGDGLHVARVAGSHWRRVRDCRWRPPGIPRGRRESRQRRKHPVQAGQGLW